MSFKSSQTKPVDTSKKEPNTDLETKPNNYDYETLLEDLKKAMVEIPIAPKVIYDESKLYKTAFKQAETPLKQFLPLIFEYVAELYIGYYQEKHNIGGHWFCAYVIIPKYHQWSVICDYDYMSMSFAWNQKIHDILKDKTLKVSDRLSAIQTFEPRDDSIPYEVTYHCKTLESNIYMYSFIQNITSFNLNNGYAVGWDYMREEFRSEQGFAHDQIKLETIEKHILNVIKNAKMYQDSMYEHEFNRSCAWCNITASNSNKSFNLFVIVFFLLSVAICVLFQFN
eukprot:300744_1